MFAFPGYVTFLQQYWLTKDFSKLEVTKIEDTRELIVSTDGIRFVEEATATRFRG